MTALRSASLSHSSETVMDRLRGLRAHLEANIRGQVHLMERVVSVLTRGEMGFAHPDRPKGSFLFVGPTGVGKTELTVSVRAETYFRLCALCGKVGGWSSIPLPPPPLQ